MTSLGLNLAEVEVEAGPEAEAEAVRLVLLVEVHRQQAALVLGFWAACYIVKLLVFRRHGQDGTFKDMCKG